MAHSCTQLGSSDIAQFRELMAVFAEAFDDSEAYQGAPPAEAYVRDLLQNPHVIALAAMVVSFRDAPATRGGWGATVVSLRPPSD